MSTGKKKVPRLGTQGNARIWGAKASTQEKRSNVFIKFKISTKIHSKEKLGFPSPQMTENRDCLTTKPFHHLGELENIRREREKGVPNNRGVKKRVSTRGK